MGVNVVDEFMAMYELFSHYTCIQHGNSVAFRVCCFSVRCDYKECSFSQTDSHQSMHLIALLICYQCWSPLPVVICLNQVIGSQQSRGALMLQQGKKFIYKEQVRFYWIRLPPPLLFFPIIFSGATKGRHHPRPFANFLNVIKNKTYNGRLIN